MERSINKLYHHHFLKTRYWGQPDKPNRAWKYLLMYWKFYNDALQHSVNSDWWLNTQSRVPQADWLMLENNEKGTMDRNMPYSILLQ